jgi:predicted phage tail protein
VVRPRLAPPAEMEDAAPPRFAQAVGLGFLLVALVALLVGATVVAMVAIAFALAAAFLNAAFDFCLGCEMYLLGKRLLTR